MILTAATSKGEKFLWQGHAAGNASEQDKGQPEIIIFICNKVNFAQKEYIEKCSGHYLLSTSGVEKNYL